MIIRFIILGADTITSDPVLQAPVGNFGVQEVDTRSTVVVAGTPMTLDGDYWFYDGTELTDGVAYRYYVEVGADDVTYSIGRTTNYVSSSCLVVGRYCDSTEIERRYGYEELARWLSCGDNEEPIDYAIRLEQHMEDAATWLDDELRGSLVVPFTVVPAKITDLAIDVTALRLYESKGTVDINTTTGYPEHRLGYVRKRVDAELAKIRSGRVRVETDDRIMTMGVVVD